MLQGDADAAYAAAMAGCRADRLYATALPFMGELYFSKGQYATSEKFFRGGYAVDPQISNGLFHFGNCLVKNGKLREAIGVYEQDVKRNGSFPTHFLMAQTYLVLGERQAALATLKLALNGLRMPIPRLSAGLWLMPSMPVWSSAIRKIIRNWEPLCAEPVPQRICIKPFPGSNEFAGKENQFAKGLCQPCR
ncbi:MAG: hypothetical protein A2076_02070 [Geobacteraceae bacterium GWC2_53_11]|nr:MAG: hypothetical protein A2076_02070 [Geobacteraceae bacterium GWC2_53_11]